MSNDQSVSYDSDTEGGPQQKQRNSQQGQQQTEQSENSSHQDIRNAQWLTLSNDEQVLWWGHPSLIPHLPVILMSIFTVIVGIALVIMYPERIGLYGLLLVPFGILGAVFDYTRVVTTFYVVTDDKVVRKRGVVRRDTIEMRYENIEHVNAKQSISERFLGYGDVELASAGTSSSEAYLDDVRQPRAVSQTINQQKDNAYNQLGHPTP